MLLTTIENIGRPYTVYGMVRGSTIQCKNIGRDLMSGMRTLVGGEMGSYTEMMDEARDIATARMVEEAERLGADAVVGVRYTTSSVVQGAAEVLVYGTAVRLD
ncbi:MAG: heavy metal-binding domain-containing protein [Butyricicoccus sp.]